MDNVYIRLDHERASSPVYRGPSKKPVVVQSDRFGRFTMFDSEAAAAGGVDVAAVLGRTVSELGWEGGAAFVSGCHSAVMRGLFVRKIIRGTDGFGGVSARLVQMTPCTSGGFIGYGLDITDLGPADFRRIGADYSRRVLAVNDDISLTQREFLVLDQISQGFPSSHVRRALQLSAAEFAYICKRLCAKFDCNLTWLPYIGTQKGALVTGLFEQAWVDIE